MTNTPYIPSNPMLFIVFGDFKMSAEYHDIVALRTITSIACHYGLTQAKLPIAYDNIHHDVRITRQKR